MVSGATILNKLPRYENKYLELENSQSVSDIMDAIKEAHKEFAPHYDNIYSYFISHNCDEYIICENIFNFLRKNTSYFVESENKQTVKSPSAILTTKKIDCKNYALFAGGVLDAINRNTDFYIPYCYRFISDNLLDESPNHVFICAYPNSDDELFIDPIPQVKYFNDKINYYYKIDKKYKAMSLYKVSGIFDSKSVDKEDNSLAIAVKAGTQAAAALIKSVFTKNGVSPSFFNTFPFLNFLDNSEGHWKSRLALMQNWTPEQRISYYIDAMNKGEDFGSSANQYARNFGRSWEHINDVGKVPFELLSLFNDIAEQQYFKGADGIQSGAWWVPKNAVLNDLTTAPDYEEKMKELEDIKIKEAKQSESIKAGVNPLVLLGVGAGVLYLINKK